MGQLMRDGSAGRVPRGFYWNRRGMLFVKTRHAAVGIGCCLLAIDVSLFFSPHGSTAQHGPRPTRRWGFEIAFISTRTHTHTLGRTPLDEGSARRRDLYLTTHNAHNRKTSMPTAGFEPETPENEHPQTHALDRTASGLGMLIYYILKW
jgi:hypothetical protein